MNLYPYINIRKVKLFYRRHREVILLIIFELTLLLVIKLVIGKSF